MSHDKRTTKTVDNKHFLQWRIASYLPININVKGEKERVMRKVKIGFYGCGFMGQVAHLQNYARLVNDCEVIGVADAKQRQAELVAAKYQIPNVYKTPAEMLANPEIEAVAAIHKCSNNVNIIPEVLAAGKHIITEKPLCTYVENARKLAELAAKANRIHMVGYHKRSDPAVEYARKTILQWKETGKMGRMKYVRITMPPGDWLGGMDRSVMINTGEPYPEFAREQSTADFGEKAGKKYGSFINYYIHQVNLMRYLLTEDYKLTFTDRSGVMLAVESVGGVCGIIEMEPYKTTDDWQESATVCFEKGWIKIELPAPLAMHLPGNVTVFENDGAEGRYITPALPKVCAMKNQALNFIKAVRGDIEAPCNSAEGVRDLEIAVDYINYRLAND